MVLTRDFKETIQARVARDPAFRKALLKEGVEALLSGDMTTGKAVLRDYINATVGFETLSAETRIPSKSLMRMFGPKGNPNARNLFQVLGYLQQREGVRFEIRASR
ncbi:conserved hypothetical protein (plasmid) [Nitrosococcus halophilus Nc 4]|uniref:Uncharacterized protein n=1 Tax=Nitrosococcus halophilus (strain Nc4) TaxID=472759 RepID=D5C5C2_NITHN|nr:hypothetical protein [Nitrosococcus halophilus]ADE16976.1 conserved hypothetical protein [Nitrosococcus halophilus Nc 4]